MTSKVYIIERQEYQSTDNDGYDFWLSNIHAVYFDEEKARNITKELNLSELEKSGEPDYCDHYVLRIKEVIE